MFNYKIGAGTGYAQIFYPIVKEFDTFTCSHCNSIAKMKPFHRPEDTHGFCDKCCKLICPRCLNKAKKNGEKCDPWEEKMQRAEARYKFLVDAGLWGDRQHKITKDPLGIVK